MPDTSRTEALHPPLQLQALDLGSLVAHAADLLAPLAAAAAVSIDRPVGGPPLLVQADATRLRQVLAELLGNAVAFNRPGGRIKLRLGSVGGHALLAVADTGVGIAPEHLTRWSDPSAWPGAAARPGVGSGPGLARSQRLALATGGRIDVRSAPGQGSCFTLWLPLAPGLADRPDAASMPAAGDAPAPQAVPAVLATGLRLAYVEDDAVNAILMREMLAEVPGLRLTVLPSAARALEVARDGEAFDLWIVDCHLPDDDGVDLLARLRQRGAGWRAVMLSADAQLASEQRALAAGYEEYWTKPLSRQALMAGLARQALLNPTLPVRGEPDPPDAAPAAGP